MTLAWGIIGTGAIAHALARGLATSRTGKLLAVGSRSQESADKFGQEFKVDRCYASYEALLADKDVQAVYVSTPHPWHAQWAIQAAQAGKHVLCEKPFALNNPQSMAIVAAAQEHGTFLMEAFMYRCHPQTRKLVELIRDKAIGQVRMIEASFGFHAGFQAEGRLWSNAMAGGGIMDVGGYPVSMSRLLAAAALGQETAEPIDIKAVGKLAPTGVDEYAAALLTFPGDIFAQVATGVGLTLENVVRVYGSEGQIFVPNPWTADRGQGGEFTIVIQRGGQSQEIKLQTSVTAYSLEADVVGDAVAAGKQQASFPAMTWADTLGNMKTLDGWRRGAGVVYDEEKPVNQTQPVLRQPLRVRKNNPMRYGRIPGVNKDVSRVVMGVDNQTFMPHASIMFDDFFERGGNAFDTAYIYGPDNEGNLGWWIHNRGLREQVVIIDKGAHTPFCNPDDLSSQFKQSLERLKTDYVDIYMLHRDNEQIPVGEFVDVLNEHAQAGRMRAFGGSNWSLERIKKANAYAKRKGLQGFTVLSNNFSLARMVDPVWNGCIQSSDAPWRTWLKKNQFILLPWSSQARGFFTDRGDPARQDAEMARCWNSDDNLQRRQRAFELARGKGVEPINIALAYVLNQPFPTFPLIGPRTLAETRSSLAAMDVELTPKELRWLNLEA